MSDRKTGAEHILVCLSSAPSNAKIVRTAASMSRAFGGDFTALFVKTPEFEEMSDENKARLEENKRLAESLGASITTVFGDNVSHQIAEFARLSDVTRVVLGRSGAKRTHRLGKLTLTEELIINAPNLDIYIIPDSAAEINKQRRLVSTPKKITLSAIRGIGTGALILALCSLLGYLFKSVGFSEANILSLFILGILANSVMSNSRIAHIVTPALGIILFDILFSTPTNSVLSLKEGYITTLAATVAASIISGGVFSKMRRQRRESMKAAYRTQILFDTNRFIARASSEDEINDAAAGQITKLLSRDIFVFLDTGDGLSSPVRYDATSLSITKPSIYTALESYKSGERIGAGCPFYQNDDFLYIPIKIGRSVYGVLAIEMSGERLDFFEDGIISSIIGEWALALENDRNAKEKHEAAIKAKNETLRANLLRSISHDLRSPLTSISGNADNLLTSGEMFDEETRKQIYSDIYDDAMWLYNLVENLLSVTRIEEGRMSISMTQELVDEVIEEALRHTKRRTEHHSLTTDYGDELLLARMDTRLIVQVVVNLIDNAVKYTPHGSHISIKARKIGDKIQVSVADDGDGIPEETKAHLFEMFYTGVWSAGDSRRSMGLGLALCRSIITAHGGDIFHEDNIPHGSVFTFILPSGGVTIHE